jgi:D-arabinose 1-dehydrogenase-like Zn-dependent alcohol dehydrogenase
VQDLDMKKLAALTTHVKLEDVPQVAEQIVQGKVRGRVVVDL